MLALLYTDVVRAVFLFYLLPIWAMLAAHLLFGEAITVKRVVAILLTLTGVWLLLGGSPDQLLVRPGFGDYLAILAGMTWGLGLALLTDKESLAPASNALSTFIMASVFAVASLVIVPLLPETGPGASLVSGSDPLLVNEGNRILASLLTVGFGAVLLAPSVIMQVWGAAELPASVAAILTTTEIVVATVTAIALIGTTVNFSGAIGAILIALAIIITVRSQTEQTG